MSIQNYLEKIKTSIFGKDVRQSIHDAIKQCYDDASVVHDNANMEVKMARGTYDTLNDRITENEKKQEKISSQLDTKVEESALKTLEARMDTFTKLPEGSTTGDAELIDGRVGADGVTYNTIGQAIRTQISRLDNEIFGEPTFNQVELSYIAGFYNLSGEISTGSNEYRAELTVKAGEIYKINGASYWQMPLYAILDSDRNKITTFPTSAVSEEYEKVINIEQDGILIINFTGNRSGSSEEYKPKVYKKVYSSKIGNIENSIVEIDNSVKSNEEQILNIKGLITGTEFKEVELTFQANATNTSGAEITGSQYFHCDIEINSILKYKVSGYNYWQMPLYVILDKDGKLLEKYPNSAQEPLFIKKEITSFPVGAVTLRVNYTTTYAGTGDEYKSKCYKTDSIFDVNTDTDVDVDTPLSNIGKTSVFTSIFSKYGIIGDSLSSGAQDTEGGGNAVDMPHFSWATFLEKSTGCETVRLCRGGLQLKNWHSSFESKARLEENKCPAYIIMLGHNDTASDLGTIEDINLSNLSNSSNETQFGMYGRLIGTLRDISPNCRIFCVTYPIFYVENYGTNNIARTLPSYIENCYCIDLWKYDENRKSVGNTSFATPNPYFSKLHGTVLGYKHWSDIIVSYIDYIIRHNLTDFADIGYINTEYSFS